MKLSSLALTFVCLLPALLSSTCGRVGKTATAFEMNWDGEQRSYLLYEPQAVSGGKTSPLVIALHGADMDAGAFQQYLGLDRLAASEGFRVIYPQGLSNTWNIEGTPYYGKPSSADDKGYIAALIRRALKEHNVSADQVYVTGYSAGGCLSYVMAWQYPDLVAAVAPLHAGIHVALRGDFVYDGGVPTLVIQGEQDPYFPIDGGPGGPASGKRKYKTDLGRGFMGLKELVDRVADENGCHLQTDAIEVPDQAPDDGCEAMRLKYTTCTYTTDLILVKNGGHNLPGRAGLQDEEIAGKTCMDFDPAEVVWDFFKAHRK